MAQAPPSLRVFADSSNSMSCRKNAFACNKRRRQGWKGTRGRRGRPHALSFHEKHLQSQFRPNGPNGRVEDGGSQAPVAVAPKRLQSSLKLPSSQVLGFGVGGLGWARQNTRPAKSCGTQDSAASFQGSPLDTAIALQQPCCRWYAATASCREHFVRRAQADGKSGGLGERAESFGGALYTRPRA